MSARLAPVDVTTADGKNKELFSVIKSKFGKVPNMMKTMAKSPAALEGYLNLAGSLGNSVLSAKIREQIALAVSQANGCVYCVSGHTVTGKLAGLSPEQVIEARLGKAEDPIAQAAINLALNLMERKGNVSDEQLETARKAGLSDAELTEIVAQVALTTLTNYFNQFVHTDVDFPHVSLTM